jgi:two-component system phosphate regulon response regulator OmpR
MPADERKKRPAKARGLQAGERTGPAILIIEDDEVNRDFLAAFLGDHGFRPSAVATGEEGIRRLSREAFDLLVLDLMLPGKTGAEVAWHAREAGLKTPILAISAAMDQWDPEDLRDLGVTATLAKPYSNDELLEVVRRILRGGAAPTVPQGHPW